MRCTGFSRTEQCLRHVHSGGVGPGPATARSSSAPSTLAGPRLACWPRGLPWPARAAGPWRSSAGQGLSMHTRAIMITPTYVLQAATYAQMQYTWTAYRHIKQLNSAEQGKQWHSPHCIVARIVCATSCCKFRTLPPNFPCKYICKSGVQPGAQPWRNFWLLAPGCSRKDASASHSQSTRYPVAILFPAAPPARSLSLSLSPHLDMIRGNH